MQIGVKFPQQSYFSSDVPSTAVSAHLHVCLAVAGAPGVPGVSTRTQFENDGGEETSAVSRRSLQRSGGPQSPEVTFWTPQSSRWEGTTSPLLLGHRRSFPYMWATDFEGVRQTDVNALTCHLGEGATSCCLGAMQRPGGAAHRIAQRSKPTTQNRENTTP